MHDSWSRQDIILRITRSENALSKCVIETEPEVENCSTVNNLSVIQLRQALDTRIGYLVHDIPRLFRNFDLPPSNKIETHDFHHLSIQLSLGQPHRKYFSMLLYERSTLSFPLSILFYFPVTITSSPTPPFK